jgi:hypothetical protein
MEERNERPSVLGTTNMWIDMWIDILNGHVDLYSACTIEFHRYSRVDDMNRSDTHAILAQLPYDFNGGEICTSVGTLHNIHVIPWILSLYDD